MSRVGLTAFRRVRRARRSLQWDSSSSASPGSLSGSLWGGVEEEGDSRITTTAVPGPVCVVASAQPGGNPMEAFPSDSREDAVDRDPVNRLVGDTLLGW